MHTSVEVEDLNDWINSALKATITYHKERQILWKSFVDILGAEGEFEIPKEHLRTIRTFLLARNDRLNDDKELSFFATLDALSEQLDLLGAGNGSGVGRPKQQKSQDDPK